MRSLSKSRLLAYRQCPKRLWLEVHRPELRSDSATTEQSFATGNEVGTLARALYDPCGLGTLIDTQAEGVEAALQRTRTLLEERRPIFEAGFRAEGAHFFADILLPCEHTGENGWRLVEVKSVTKVVAYHHDDIAIQAFVARSAGLRLAQISVAHIDNAWTYPGKGDYQGLLKEVDLTAQANSASKSVPEWIAAARAVLDESMAPGIRTGAHCNKPYECGFLQHCRSQEPSVAHPITWLPGRKRKQLAAHLADTGGLDMADCPDELLSPDQLRVKRATLFAEPVFDQPAAARALSPHGLPLRFLDFETIRFAVPIWEGTQPYQQIPFQFSVHVLTPSGELDARDFLDLSGSDPSRALSEALLDACGTTGAVFVYNQQFEKSVISKLASRYPDLAAALDALNARIVDLLPIVRAHYYHPDQQGSWSIKAVLPALCPGASHADLDGVQDGGQAMTAYQEAIAGTTQPQRVLQLERELRAYCALDTLAMVRIWSRLCDQPVEE